MRDWFHKKGQHRLKDMLQKVKRDRETNGKPTWIGEDSWRGLTTYWDSPEFQRLSAQNKANRASTKGGAVHTSGRIAHSEVARFLVCIVNI